MLLYSLRDTSETGMGVIDTQYLLSVVISCRNEIQFYPCKVSERTTIDYCCNKIMSTDTQLIWLQPLKYS